MIIVPFVSGEGSDIALARSFEGLYAHLSGSGLGLPLAQDGGRIWVRSIAPMLGKLTFVHCAWEGERLVGFVAGTIRTLPGHLGGGRYGALTHIHVDPSSRDQGLGRQLVDALLVTFRQKGIASMETDVLVANHGGRAFFAELGFQEDHLVLRRPI